MIDRNDRVGPPRAGVALAALVATVSALALYGWLTGDRGLVTLLPGNAAMKFNQALALFGLAATIALYASGLRRAALVPAAFALLIASLTLASHLGAPIAIDQLLHAETFAQPLRAPGRMSPSSALAVALLALSALLLAGATPRTVVSSQILAALALMIGLQRLLSYVYGVSPFTEIGRWGMMGVHSAACLVATALALVLLKPASGILPLFSGHRPGSVLARRVWLPLLLFTLLFGCVLQWSGFSETHGHGATLAVVGLASTLALAIAIGWTTNALNVSAERLIDQRQAHALLSAVNTAIARTRHQEELFDEVCRLLVTDGRFASASIGLIGVGDDGLFRNAAGEHPLRDRQPVFSKSPLSAFAAMPASGVARTGSPCVLRAEDPARDGPDGPAPGAGWEALFPLRIGDQVVGVLAVESATPGTLEPEVERLLADLSDDLAFGIDFLRKDARLNFLAYNDSLTGLPNSAMFLDHVTRKLAEPREPGEHVAVVVLDLDRFSQINDSLGRECGDALLQITARRLRRVLRREESVARLSADSFGLTLTGTTEHIVEQLVARILHCLQEPFVVGRLVRVSARAGVALAPQDGTDAHTLFANAEAALKHAQAGREPYCLYSPSINSNVAQRISMETRLRNAIDRREFVLHFQPKVSAVTRRVTGLEALLRWQDPNEGLMAPASFVPLLEDTGLMVPVGAQVVELALAARRQWQEQGIEVPRIAVNVSAVQFRRPDFVSSLRAALHAAGAEGSSLEIEITESVLIGDDGDSIISTLTELRSMGITIAVDDFGTGYSSLQYLAELPIDKLKIDRSFVATMAERPQSAAIVGTIISLARRLRLTVVAEGVETQPQALALKALGCNELQGYLFGRPRDASATAAVLRSPTAAELLGREHAQ